MPDQRFSVRAAIAAYLRVDVAEVEANHRYQPTRTPCAVYSDGNDYLTATNGARKPRECDDNQMGTWRWKEMPHTSYGASLGWRIWLADRGGDKPEQAP
jgi:hypothetical protein